MQVNDEYLDELFARKLGNWEATPPEDGWFRIENELMRRSNIRRKFWLAAASFALILSVTATMVYIQTNRTAGDHLLTAMVADSLRSEGLMFDGSMSDGSMSDYPMSDRSMSDHPMSDHSTDIQRSESEIRNQESKNRNQETEIREPNDESQDRRSQPINEVQSEIQNTKPETPTPEPEIENPKSKIENPKLEYTDSWDEILQAHVTKSQPRNRWEIAGQFAPMQSYRTITSVPDGLLKSDFDDAEKPLPVFSGGISVAYQLFDRLSIQTGVFYAQMGQSINNVTPVTNMYASISSNNAYSKNFVRTSSGSVTVASNLKSDGNTTYSEYFNPESQTAAANNILMANNSTSANYRLIERLDYLEIPLLLRYRIIDRKMNFYVLGGMSTNVLVSNSVFVDNGSELVKGGNILMARPVNYSSTVGLGLGYQISGKLMIGFEPSFKYYLQPYTTSSRVTSNPYAFGLYTGMVYRF